MIQILTIENFNFIKILAQIINKNLKNVWQNENNLIYVEIVNVLWYTHSTLVITNLMNLPNL